MKRYTWWIVLSAGIVVLVGAAFARQGRMRRDEEEWAEMPAHMGMMMAGDVAAHEGTVYLVRGGELLKLNRRLEVVKSGHLPVPEQAAGMRQGGMMGGGPGGRGMMHGAMVREHGPGPGAILMMAEQLALSDRQKGRIEEIARRAHEDAQEVLNDDQRERLDDMWSGEEESEEPSRMGSGMMGGRHMMPGMQGGMMGGGHMMPGMQAMMGRQGGPMMGHMARLTADESGVYLVAGGRLVAYDHDLNQRRTKELYEAEEGADEQPRGMHGRRHRR